MKFSFLVTIKATPGWMCRRGPWITDQIRADFLDLIGRYPNADVEHGYSSVETIQPEGPEKVYTPTKIVCAESESHWLIRKSIFGLVTPLQVVVELVKAGLLGLWVWIVLKTLLS